MSDEASYEIVTEEGVCVFRPRPTLNLEWELLGAISERILSKLAETSPPRLLIDLSKMDYFGSIFITLMLRCWKKVQQVDGKFALCGLTSNTKEVIDASHLDRLWAIYADAPSARKAFAG